MPKETNHSLTGWIVEVVHGLYFRLPFSITSFLLHLEGGGQGTPNDLRVAEVKPPLGVRCKFNMVLMGDSGFGTGGDRTFFKAFLVCAKTL